MSTVDSNPKSTEALSDINAPASKEIDVPIFGDYQGPRDPGFKATPMPDEQKMKLGLSLSIARYCFILIGAIILIYTVLICFGKSLDNSFFTNVLDIIKTMLLLSLGFMFGNQMKNQ